MTPERPSIEWDDEARAVYVKLNSPGGTVRTISHGDVVLVDVDADGYPTGVEILW